MPRAKKTRIYVKRLIRNDRVIKIRGFTKCLGFSRKVLNPL